jgi:DNA-binding NarL/FixJ family response regulator
MDTIVPVFEKIWLADDDRDDCELFDDIIRQILPGSSLTIIPNGEILMDMLTPASKPDILFLDINMPCKDGIDCLVDIRAQRHFSRLPIVIFSSTKESKFIHTSYGYGANLFYSKPNSLRELVAGLSNLFKMDWSDPYTITSNHYVNNKFVAYNSANIYG